MKILILEPGAWGTTLGILLSRKNKVSFWYKNKELSRKISQNRENNRLPGIEIPQKIFISSNLKKLVLNIDLVVIASPTFNFRRTLIQLKKYRKLFSEIFLMGIAKGIEKETLKFPSEIVKEVLPEVLYAHLSGPGFAKEIIRGKPAKEVIASENKDFLKKLKNIFKIKPLEISTTTDLIGVQLAGALKNSLAIGISLVEAAVPNSEIKKIRPKLIKISLEEMNRIGKILGASSRVFLGPVGKGDLILTSGSHLSRNFQFGKNLYLDAEKMRRDIKERKITVEGFDNTFAFYKLGKIHKINLPMINELYKLIYRKISSQKAVKNLIKLIEDR